MPPVSDSAPKTAIELVSPEVYSADPTASPLEFKTPIQIEPTSASPSTVISKSPGNNTVMLQSVATTSNGPKSHEPSFTSASGSKLPADGSVQPGTG